MMSSDNQAMGRVGVRTEIRLHCLAYIMRRVMSILGITELINAMRLMRAGV